MKISISMPIIATVLASTAFALPASEPSQDLEVRNPSPKADKPTKETTLEKRWWERRVLICSGQ
ncbi:hypothetical protein TWF481_010747 [Arthrobotrys musiformis]|uniref:Uncharacterized protein n=1 Tax=Arthrobotrys musiformis TaxID=47236 RepID=A0AAV9W1M3_9PEZI